MSKLTLFIILLITVSCTSADNQKKELQKGEPYKLELGIKKVKDNTFSFDVAIDLLHTEAYYFSPFSDGDYKGMFSIIYDENEYLSVNHNLQEIPKAKEGVDPYSNKPSTRVKENTVYKQQLTINSESDFIVSGVIQFVIEPKCTMEKIGFTITKKGESISVEKTPLQVKKEPHNYGGWYCPDNLNGFPATDIKNWENVSVINGRLPTKEETRNGSSLIFIDSEKHPNAKPLDLKMPQLAKYYNEYTKKEDIIIVIQAVAVEEDSVVGFRFLNGGNGSAWLNEVKFIDHNDIVDIATSKFVVINTKIKARQDKIWQIITNQVYYENLQPIFNLNTGTKSNWLESSNVNFSYANKNQITSAYADKLFGCWYVQNDYLINKNSYVEKFLLLENEETNETELKIVCGPFKDDFDIQKSILNNWSEKVKELSEKE